jgi:hypothetical protein
MKKEVQKNRENLLSEPKKMGLYALNDNRDRTCLRKKREEWGIARADSRGGRKTSLIDAQLRIIRVK